MWKRLLLLSVLLFLAACDSADQDTGQNESNPPVATVKTAVNKVALAQQYAGRALSVIDVSEIEEDGVSTLSVTFDVPLDPEQPLAQRLHLVDSRDGKLDGAWELTDNLMELRLRHLPPQRKLVLTIDPTLTAITGRSLEKEYVSRLETRDKQPTIGFASRGSLLPTRLVDGLPVITLNVSDIDVDFFRVRMDDLTKFLSHWRGTGTLNYYDADELLAYADLVFTGRFQLSPSENTRETVLLPLTGVKSVQQPGVYLAVMKKAGSYHYAQPATLFTLSDIGLSAHRYRDRLDIFTQALQGGAAIQNVQLQLIDQQGRVVAEGETDADGHAQLMMEDKASLLLAHKNDQTSLLPLDTAALDLAEFDLAGPKAHPLQFFVFGPRDLYRPGETVLLNALLRDEDGKPVNPQPVHVEVRRPDDQLSRRFVWQPGEGGLYQYSLTLSPEAPTGRWQLLIDLGDGQPQLYEFLVEDFLPERLALELKGSQTPLPPDAAAIFRINGRYLYGAPASGNRLMGQLFVRPLREAVAELPGYQFGSVTEDDLTQDIELDDQALDDQGHFTLSVPSRWSDAKSPLQLIYQASLQESGGRPVTRRKVQPVWPAERMVGIRPLFDDEQIDSDSEARFEILVANDQGQKLAIENLSVRLIRERRDYYWQYSDSEGWTSQYNEKQLMLAQQSLSIEKNGTAQVSFPVEWGPYRLEVEDPGTGLISSVRFWAGYRWQDNTDGGAVRPDQVKLTLDKPAYRAGDTAKVTLTPPAAGNGYLLVESAEEPLWWMPIDVPAEGKTFDIPLAQNWVRHDLYISALVVRPGERKANVTPKRAVGLLHLPLDRLPRQLSLTLDSAEKIRPNQTLNVKVQAATAEGTTVTDGYVLVAAVDTGVLNITDYRTPDPFAAFFGRKGYGVDQFDVYAQLIEGNGRLARLAFGGDAALASGGKRPQTDVQIVALQSAPVKLDAQGEAHIPLTIPDFNGELRLMAQVWTDDRFGVAESKTVVAAPVIAELAAPRFLAGGDTTEVALDVTNLSGQAQNLTVRVQGEDRLTVTGPASKPLSLSEGERQTLRMPVQALGGYGTGKITVTVEGVTVPGETIAPLQRQWTIGVRPAFPAQRDIHRQALKADPWQLPESALARYDRDGLEMFLNLSGRPPLNLAEHIRALKAYPYGCSEQTTSGLYPSLYIDDVNMARLGIATEAADQRRQAIEIGIERLLGMQRYNGSFGLWRADSDEEYWLTPYIVDFLLRARDKGYAVPEKALEKATQRLLRYLQERSLIDVNYSQNAAHTRFAVQAYAGYVLARQQMAPLGALRALFDRRSDARSGLPLVQLAVALSQMGDAPRAQQALTAGLHVQRVAGEWLGDYGSRLRDQAMILQLMEENDLLPERQDERLFELSETLATQRWLSTQERNAVFMAGRLLLDKPEVPWNVVLQLGDQSRVLSADRMLNLKLDDQELVEPIVLQNRGEGTVYQQLILSGYPSQPPAAFSENLSIERTYWTLEGQPLNLADVRSGQLVLAHLAIRVKERVPDALLVDLLPAGLELENQNLTQSAVSLKDASAQVRNWLKNMQEARIKHQEYRDDRYVAAIDIPGWGTTHVLYLARAVTPGRYRIPPPQIESMYRPAWQALGETPAYLEVKRR